MCLLDDTPGSFDANVIADFLLTGSDDLLVRLYAPGTIVVSDFVVSELALAGQAPPAVALIATLDDEDSIGYYEDYQRSFRTLGAGELGALAVARSRGIIVVSNDNAARNAATSLGMRVIGTLGILKCATARQILSPADAIALLGRMVDAGAWFSDTLVEGFKRSVLGTAVGD